MSFASLLKSELSRELPSKSCCRTALAAALVNKDTLAEESGVASLSLKFSYLSLAKMVKNLLEQQFGITAKVVPLRPLKKQKNRRYQLELSGNVSQMLNEIGSLDDSLFQRREIPMRVLSLPCCKGAFLKGVFLLCGYVNSLGHDYHLELVVHKKQLAPTLRILNDLEIPAKTRERRGAPLIYLKSSEDILSFYAVVGAHAAFLRLQDLKVQKEIKGNINRKVNCEEANLSRTVDAAMQQSKAIEILEKNPGLDKIPSRLRMAAELRKEHPQASLTELTELSGGDVNRSTLYHRLRKICSLAEQYR